MPVLAVALSGCCPLLPALGVATAGCPHLPVIAVAHHCQCWLCRLVPEFSLAAMISFLVNLMWLGLCWNQCLLEVGSPLFSNPPRWRRSTGDPGVLTLFPALPCGKRCRGGSRESAWCPPNGELWRSREDPEMCAGGYQLDQCPGADHQPRASHPLNGSACHPENLEGGPEA